MLLANIQTIINTKLLRSNIYIVFYVKIKYIIIINLRLDREIEFHYMILEIFFK